MMALHRRHAATTDARAHNEHSAASGYRTRYCICWQEERYCPRRDACSFAHGPGQLSPDTPPLYKTTLCHNYNASVGLESCTFGLGCFFAHGHRELRGRGSGTRIAADAAVAPGTARRSAAAAHAEPESDSEGDSYGGSDSESDSSEDGGSDGTASDDGSELLLRLMPTHRRHLLTSASTSRSGMGSDAEHISSITTHAPAAPSIYGESTTGAHGTGHTAAPATNTAAAAAIGAETDAEAAVETDGDAAPSPVYAFRHKTRYCRYWCRTGEPCRNGALCRFAHGPADLSDSTFPSYKSRLCAHYEGNGGAGCDNGYDCLFAHGQRELRAQEGAAAPATATVPVPLRREGAAGDHSVSPPPTVLPSPPRLWQRMRRLSDSSTLRPGSVGSCAESQGHAYASDPDDDHESSSDDGYISMGDNSRSGGAGDIAGSSGARSSNASPSTYASDGASAMASGVAQAVAAFKQKNAARLASLSASAAGPCCIFWDIENSTLGYEDATGHVEYPDDGRLHIMQLKNLVEVGLQDMGLIDQSTRVDTLATHNPYLSNQHKLSRLRVKQLCRVPHFVLADQGSKKGKGDAILQQRMAALAQDLTAGNTRVRCVVVISSDSDMNPHIQDLARTGVPVVLLLNHQATMETRQLAQRFSNVVIFPRTWRQVKDELRSWTHGRRQPLVLPSGQDRPCASSRGANLSDGEGSGRRRSGGSGGSGDMVDSDGY